MGHCHMSWVTLWWRHETFLGYPSSLLLGCCMTRNSWERLRTSEHTNYNYTQTSKPDTVTPPSRDVWEWCGVRDESVWSFSEKFVWSSWHCKRICFLNSKYLLLTWKENIWIIEHFLIAGSYVNSFTMDNTHYPPLAIALHLTNI